MQPKLEITYTPEKKDYVKASRTLAMKTKMFLILAIVLAVGIVASIVILLIPSLQEAYVRNIAVVVLWVGVFYVLYFFALIPLQLNRAYKKNEFMQLARQFTFTDEKLKMSIADKSTELEWEHLRKVIFNDGLYLLVYKKDSPVYPFIHERAFADDAEKQSFINFLNEKSIPIE